jgi:hypothetical protein
VDRQRSLVKGISLRVLTLGSIYGRRAAADAKYCEPRVDLFDGRHQLIVYRAFFEPGVKGWPEHACIGCSMVADQVAHPAHLEAR